MFYILHYIRTFRSEVKSVFKICYVEKYLRKSRLKLKFRLRRNIRLLLHLRPNYIHSASNDIHTDGPRATARVRG